METSSTIAVVHGMGRHRKLAIVGLALAILVGVLIRVLALESDHYLRLDWSAGLLTDEGFYTHNAKNSVIFGNPRTDEFNNMLLSPLLHTLQVAVFRVFGAGAVSARAISVVCGLLAVFFLWVALNRVTSKRVAFTAAIFLLLDHPFALFNRMALMDTPAACGATFAFWAFVRAKTADRFANAWYLLSGAAMAATVTNRMLAIFLIGGPLAVLAFREPRFGRDRMRMDWWAFGLIGSAMVYMVIWYLPNRTEISLMNHYYRVNQVQPSSVIRWLINMQHGLFGDFRGLSPYLFRHTPILFGLSIAGIVMAWFRRKAQTPDSTTWLYLAGWFMSGSVVLSSINYSPARYYVTLYPAMAGLSALAIWRLTELAPRLAEWKVGCRVLVAAGVGFAVFHGLLSVIHYQSGGLGSALLYVAPVVVGGSVMAFWNHWVKFPARTPSRTVVLIMGIWCAVNAVWLLDWTRNLDYSRLRMERQISKVIHSQTVVIGDLAPGLTLNLPVKAIHVQPGLCNFDRPVERFGQDNALITVLDGRFREKYWMENYPWLVDPSNRAIYQQVMRWEVGVYQWKPTPVRIGDE